MRSPLSNPVEAGVDSFTKLMGTFNQIEDSKMKRELMAQNAADRRIENEWKQKEHTETQHLWDKEHEREHGTDMLNVMAGVKQKYEDSKASGQPFDVAKLDDKEHDAIHYAQGLHGTSSSDLGDLMDFIQTAGQQVQGKKGQIPLDERKARTLTSALQIPTDKLNTDDYGNKVEGRLVGAAVDGTSPDMPTGLMVERTLKPGIYKHISDDKNEIYVAPDANPKNMISKGNIDLNSRKVTKNEDGSISTVLSMGIAGPNGEEILIPGTSKDGKVFKSRTEAESDWKKTVTKDKPFGDNLGVFSDIESSNKYAQELHASKLWKKDLDYYGQNTHKDLLKMGEGSDPSAPYNIHPAQLLVSKFNLQKEFADMYDQIEAKTNPEEFRKKRETTQKAIAENRATVDAYKTSGGDAEKFMQTMLEKHPEMSTADIKSRFDSFLKTKPKMESSVGKEMADREELIRANGGDENTPDVKKFDEMAKGKEAGANKTIYGPKGQTKEVFLKKGEDFTPPKGWSLKAPHEGGEAAEMKTRGEVDKIEGLIVKNYRQGDKNVETIDDLDISDESKAELQDKKDKAIKLIEKGKSATAAWNDVDKKKTKDPEKPKPAKKLDRSLLDKVTGTNKDIKDGDPAVEKATKGISSAKEAVKALVDAGFNEQHSIDYVKKHSKKAN